MCNLVSVSAEPDPEQKCFYPPSPIYHVQFFFFSIKLFCCANFQAAYTHFLFGALNNAQNRRLLFRFYNEHRYYHRYDISISWMRLNSLHRFVWAVAEKKVIDVEMYIKWMISKCRVWMSQIDIRFRSSFCRLLSFIASRHSKHFDRN